LFSHVYDARQPVEFPLPFLDTQYSYIEVSARLSSEISPIYSNQLDLTAQLVGCTIGLLSFLKMKTQNRLQRSPTSWYFSYDFGVTVIRHQNADAIVLASARLRGIHPPDNIQNCGRPGGGSQTRTG
jgi:hypothetical protein